MTEKIFYAAPILNVPILFDEDETSQHGGKNQSHQKDQDDDLIFGALDEESPSTDEGICLRSSIERTKKRERAYSSISIVDDQWENILPITEGDGFCTSINHLQSINGKSSTEPIIGMSNFRVKHRLRRRSIPNALVRWKSAVKKVIELKDPW
jgi:hypothetical protein